MYSIPRFNVLEKPDTIDWFTHKPFVIFQLSVKTEIEFFPTLQTYLGEQ